MNTGHKMLNHVKLTVMTRHTKCSENFELNRQLGRFAALDFLQNIDGESDLKSEKLAFIPESYISETRLRIDAYRKVASASTEKEVDLLEDEMQDRFGPLPDQVISLLLESKVRCLAENADFDLVETKGKELLLRYAKRGNAGERRFCRKLGHLPKLKASKPLLKLNEIIQYLKIYIHGKNK